MQKLVELDEEDRILELVRSFKKVLLMDVSDDGVNVCDWLKFNGKKIRNYVTLGEEVEVPVVEGIIVKQLKSLVSWNREALLICLEKDNIEQSLIVVKQLEFENILIVKEGFINKLAKEPIYEINNKVYQSKLEKLKTEKKNNKDKVDVLLLTPPAWDIYTPFGALPCLVAALQQDNILAEQIDIGILSFHTKLRREWKDYAKSFLSSTYYDNVVTQYEKNPYQRYEEYKNDLWFFAEDVFPIEVVKTKYESLNRVQIGVLDVFFQSIANGLSVNMDFTLEKSIKKALQKYDKNLLLDSIIEMNIVEKIVDTPLVVGISVTGTNQFLPGCALAKIIKFYNPNTKIIVGGSALDVFLASSYPAKDEILEYFDYLISGEGETAIRELTKSIYQSTEIDYKSIPNLVEFTKEGEMILPEVYLEEVDDLPAPCFDGIDFGLYLAPTPMIPYQASRGCHYGHCAFCNHNTKYRHNYRTKKPEKVVEELVQIKKKYGIKYFQFVDEAIRPDCFEEMIEAMDICEEFKDTKWIFYSRVSYQYKKELLEKAKRNGCEMVMFGVETFNQRLLNFIRKGISAETSKYCIKLFSEVGIKTFIWLMCNLPSETIEEMREDIVTVKKYSPYLSGMGLGPFYLDVNTDMYRDMEKFNIVSYNPYDGTRFDSINEGILIDKDETFQVYGTEYAILPQKYFFTTNRYTIFYDGLK